MKNRFAVTLVDDKRAQIEADILQSMKQAIAAEGRLW